MTRAVLAVLGAVGLAGCVDHKPGITGTQSLGIELVSPADPGAIDRRLPDSVRDIALNVTAYDEGFTVDTSFNRDVEVYAQFLGTVTPTPTLSDLGEIVATPLARFHLTAGKAMGQTVTLPTVLGPTTVGSVTV